MSSEVSLAEGRPQERTPYLHDESLCILLSRLAALQGQAVPAHRFGFMARTEDGVDMQSLSAAHKAAELWRARFAGAEVAFLSTDGLSAREFPLLWVGTDGRTGLVRGRLSSGLFQVEEASGRVQERTADTLKAGDWLALRISPLTHEGHEGPRTATEWFIHAIQQHRRIFLEGMLATLVISTLGLFASLYTMQVYDRVVPTRGFSTLWVLTVGVALAIAFEYLMKQVRARMIDRATKAMDLELSAVFFGQALDIRMDARPSTVGTFASQIRHFESVRSFMTSTTLFVLADAPFAIFFIVVMFMIGGQVAWVPVIMVPCAVLVGLMSRQRIERLTETHMEDSNRKNGLLIEAIDGIESVKAAGGEWKMLDRYRALTARIAGSELDLKHSTTTTTHLAQAIQQINYVGMIAVGAFSIAKGDLTMGGLMACSIISGRALAPMAQIPGLIVQWKHAQIALRTLDRIMAMPRDRADGQRLVVPEQCRGAMRLDNVRFGYRKDQAALDVSALRIQPGERVAILGSVGSGKSTLLKLLSGLYKPVEGAVYLDEVEISHLAPEFVREHIGYLPQDVRLFNGTLRDNLTLGLPTPSDSLILRAAALTGLDAVIKSHPQGLELDIQEGGRGLSGGQRQLVGLTRMLLAKPRLLLLDEPTASMDGQLEAQVMHHLFRELPPESGVVVVTHKTGILPHVQRIILVDRGTVVADGPRDEILARLQKARTASGPRTGPTSVTSQPVSA